MASDDLDAISLLIEELRNDEQEVRTKAVARLTVIASALGPDRTRNELVPFLNESTEDEDEILEKLADQLGQFAFLVGGPEHLHCLLKPLEDLAGKEETVVRDKAAESMCKVVEQMKAGCDSVLVPVIRNLSQGDWFTPRVSACALFGTFNSKCTESESQETLRKLFHTLCHDETPMVKRAAASHLGKYAASITNKGLLKTEILEMCNSLAKDDQDSVRLLAVENFTQLGKMFTEEESRTLLLPAIKLCVEDKSWRVRFNVAKEFHSFSEALGENLVRDELLKLYLELMNDSEAEVRGAACKNIAKYCDLVGEELFVKEMVPLIQQLAQDTGLVARSSLSTSCMELAPLLKEDTYSEYIVPLLKRFLFDDNKEVRLNVLDKLGCLQRASLNGLMPILIENAKDQQWRVRRAITKVVEVIARTEGEITDEQLELLFLSLKDPVSDVRVAACEAIRSLVKSMPAKWIESKILPQVCKQVDSKIYQERITAVMAVFYMCTTAEGSAVEGGVPALAIAALDTGLKDAIANVRFATARFVQDMTKNGCSKQMEGLRATLDSMSEDKDEDVTYFASAAVAEISK